MIDSRKVGMAPLLTVCLFFSLSLTGVGSSVGMLGSLLLSQFSIIGPVIYVAYQRKEKLADQLSLYKMKISDIALCILYYVCVRFVLELASTISLLYSENVVSERIIEMSKNVPFVVCALVVAILPAIGEELLFRGIMYTKYRKTSPLCAMLLCSIFFGILHGNLNQFTYTVIAGLAFVLLVEASGSLVSSIIVHCIVNMRSVIAVYALPFLTEKLEEAGEDVASLLQNPSHEEIISRLPQTIISGVCGAICGFLILRFIAKRNSRFDSLKSCFKRTKNENQMLLIKENIFQAPLVIALVLAVTYMLLTELSIRGVLK